MSDTQTKKTNQAALITALGSTDQLLLTDANTGQVSRISLADLTTAIAAGISVAGLSYTVQTTGSWIITDGVGLILIHEPGTHNCFLGLATVRNGVDASIQKIVSNTTWQIYISMWGSISMPEGSRPDNLIFHCIKFQKITT